MTFPMPTFSPAEIGSSDLEISVVHTAFNGTGQSTYTFSSVNFGAAASGGKKRWIAVFYGANKNTTRTLTSATIDGVTAASVFHEHPGGSDGAGVIIAEIVSATSGIVELTFSNSYNALSMIAYRIISQSSADLTAFHATAFDHSHSSGNNDITIDCPAEGVILGASISGNAGVTDWTGLTEDYEVDAKSNEWHSFASDAFATIQTGLAISTDNSQNSPGRISLYTMSWGPNGVT